MTVVVAMSTLSACASAPPAPERATTFVLYPPPPDTPRVQYLTSISNSRDVETPRNPSFWDRLSGDVPEEEASRSVLKPYGVTMDRGRIFVCDTRLNGIVVIDLSTKQFEQWTPTGFGQLQKPINCFVDPSDGRLYVADVDRGDVVVFDKDRNFVTAFAADPESRPVDVFVKDGQAWVADYAKRQVQVFEGPTFELTGVIPRADVDSAGVIVNPTNLWVTDNRAYVSDVGAADVKVYEHNGTYLRTIGTLGRNPGQFVRPKGVAVDREGVVYVVDAATSVVQMFDHEGQTLMYFGGPYAGPGDMWLPAKVTVDYDDLDSFRNYVHESLDLKYLILVTNQFGPDKISVYGRVEPVGGGE